MAHLDTESSDVMSYRSTWQKQNVRWIKNCSNHTK